MGGRSWRDGWPWLVAPAVFAVVLLGVDHIDLATSAIIGAGLIALVVAHPGRAIMVMVTALPFDLYGSAALYRIGVPASVLAPARFWPEAILAGLVVAALKGLRRTGVRLDAVDLAALGYVALATLYLLVPKVFLSAPVGIDVSFYGRELGWRSDVLYVVVLLVARRLPVDSFRTRQAMLRTVSVGTVVAALGIFEFLAPGLWNRLAAGLLRVPRYQQNVLHGLPIRDTLTSVEQFGSIDGHLLVRVGSVLDYESLGFYLALAIGLAVELAVRGQGPRWLRWVLPVLGVGVYVTQTRSGILAAAVAVALSVLGRLRRDPALTRRVAAGLAAVVVVGAAFYVAGGTGRRLAGDRVSDAAHTASINQGIQALYDYPQGRGLATSGPQYKRSALSTAGLAVHYTGPATGILVTDDQWLAVGTELGFAGLALFVLLCGLAVRRLSFGGLTYPTALRNSLIGILVGGTFIQPFTNDAVSLTLFLLIGLALGPPSAGGGNDRAQPATTSVTAR